MSGMQSSFVDVTIANDEGAIVHMKSPAQQLLSKNNSFVLDSESSDEKHGDQRAALLINREISIDKLRDVTRTPHENMLH